MNWTINLSDEQGVILAAKAKGQGLSAEEYARVVLAQDLAPEWLRKSWESAQGVGLDRLSAEEIDTVIDAVIVAARQARLAARPHPGA